MAKGRTAKRPASKKPRAKRSAAARRPTMAALGIKPPAAINMTPPKIGKESLAVGTGAHPDAQTVVYIHGIANKPPASILKCQWDHALFGRDLGDRSRMAYWVNRDFYPQPEAGTCEDSDLTKVDDDEMSTRSVMALAK